MPVRAIRLTVGQPHTQPLIGPLIASTADSSVPIHAKRLAGWCHNHRSKAIGSESLQILEAEGL